MWRRMFIDWPAKALDLLWLGYCVCIAALSLLAMTTVALTLVAYLLGYRLFW